jgi:SAM-dependent methyltransferase
MADMHDQQARGLDQAKLWNGHAGKAWVQAQDILDQMLRPFENALLDKARAMAPRPARVLDIGCGTGGTTLALARGLTETPGPGSFCMGVDISAPMIAAARARAAAQGSRAAFVCDDVQTHRFEPASFDLMVSRFGVMFFEDPLQAFSNLRQAARDGARLHVLAWRGAAENPFMTTAERAAAPLLQEALPARRPDGPGQFAFADRQHVTTILGQSGWGDIDIQAIDAACTLPERDLARYVSWLGPVGGVLQQMDDARREVIVARLLKAFEPYVDGETVRFNAACWMVSAHAG